MRRNLTLIAVALIAILAATLLLDDNATPPPSQSIENPAVSDIRTQPAPNFQFRSFGDEHDRNLTDFKGKVVILHFWASWCAPCIIEFPKLIALSRASEHNRDNLVVLAVSIDSDRDDMTRFLKKIQFKGSANFLITQDANKSISQDLFQTIRVPETIIIDPSGNMVRKIAGDADWQSDEISTYLSGLAAPASIP